jgi:hypothetical protein
MAEWSLGKSQLGRTGHTAFPALAQLDLILGDFSLTDLAEQSAVNFLLTTIHAE